MNATPVTVTVRFRTTPRETPSPAGESYPRMPRPVASPKPDLYANSTRRRWIVLSGTVVVFILITLAMARANAPWEDESWFGSTTYTLMNEGRLATTLIEGAGTWRAGTARHFYWEPPLSFVGNSFFCMIAGFSLVAVRAASVSWACLALICIGLLMWKLTGRELIAALAVFLVSVDYFFLQAAADARMDAMCFSLGIAGITAYVLLRERSLRGALVLSHSLVVMSGATHPNGMLWFACLAAAILMYDRNRLTGQLIAWAAMPYAIGAIAWGLFIGADPRDFVTQFIGNVRESSASNALQRSPLTVPLNGFITEIRERYLGPYGLLTGVGALNRLKAIALLVYLSSIGVAVSVPSLRSYAPVRLLLRMMLIIFLLFAFVTGNKWSRYLIHLTPLWGMLLAIVIGYLAEQRYSGRPIATALVGVMALLQWSGALHHIRQNTYAREYLPTARFIEQNSSQSSFIIGPAGFFWSLWGKRQFVNDLRLGFLSGRRADVIVINDWYRKLLLNGGGEMSGARDYARQLLSGDFEPKWSRGEYTVYLRKFDAKTVIAASASQIRTGAN